MSADRAKERHNSHEKKAKESFATKKHRSEDPNDSRPIITQEKIQKPSASTLKEKGTSQNERSMVNKSHKRKTDIHDDLKRDRRIAEKDKRASNEGQVVRSDKVKRLQSMESRIGKDNKLDAIYLRDLLEKRGIKKSEGEKSLKEKTKVKSTTKTLSESETKIMRREEEIRKMKSRRDRTRTRTLSPTEIKQLLPSKTAYEMTASDIGLEEERKVEEKRKSKQEEAITGGSDEEYEDDFEDYDSDFEVETDAESQESPKNSASETTPTLQTEKASIPNAVVDSWKLSIRKQELREIKKYIEKENYELLERRKSVTKLREDDLDIEDGSRLGPMSGQLIDFSSASRKQKKNKKVAASRKRGEELLSMITLDAISYSILEIPAIPYEDFIKAFGKSNAKQVQVQTNEDDLDEEVQTDEILLSNKWTQKPAEYLGSRGKTGSGVSFILTNEERLGVGGDVPSAEKIISQPNMNALWNFLSWSSQLVLIALEKKSGNFLSLESMPNHSKAMAFGDGFVSLNVGDIPFLKGRSVTHLCLLSKSIERLLSVHVNKEKSFQKCMICVWSLRELSKPVKILIAFNLVSACCFGLNQGNMVFAGLSDGSICLWDLREPYAYHNRMSSIPEWSLQSPTYTTAGNLIDSGHFSPIVAVRLLNTVDSMTLGFGDFTPMQICSLDKDGIIVIWTVVQLEKAQRSGPSDDLGLAHWGRVKLVKSSSFSVFASLRDEIPGLYITCNDIIINEAEDDGFYVANSLGSVHHCSAYGSPMKPKFYVPSKQDAIIETTCLELCPFNGNYFLVGCGDGTIRLHSRHQDYPLICLNSSVMGNEKEAPIVSLTWMAMRPCVFFALDSMSRINIWDLGVSDMYPEISLVLTEKKITCMKLLPISDPRQVPFIVIGTEGGSIEIHKLKQEYGCRTASDVQNEMKMFLKYVSIL